MLVGRGEGGEGLRLRLRTWHAHGLCARACPLLPILAAASCDGEQAERQERPLLAEDEEEQSGAEGKLGSATGRV